MRFALIIVLFILLFSVIACAPQPIQELEPVAADQELGQEEPVQEEQLGTEQEESEPALEQAGPISEPAPEQESTAPQLPPKDIVTAEELENVLDEIKFDERAEPMIYRLLQKERGVYTIGKKKYTIYFQNIVAPDQVEMRIEGVTKFLKLGQSVNIGMVHKLTLVSILSGATETVGDLVKFYYGTQEGLIVDYIEEGETKTYFKEGKKYVITLVTVSNPPYPKVIFEINGKRTESLESKDQEIFDDRSFLFVSNIFPNEAKEYTSQKAIEFTILEK